MAEREITLRLKVTAQGFEVLDQAGQKVGELEKKTDSLGKAGVLGLENYAKAAAGIVAGLTAAAGAIAYATKQAIDQQDAMYKLSQQVAIGVKELSGLRVVAELGDVQMTEFGQSIAFFNTKLVEASDKGSQAAKILKEMGVTAREPGPALLQVADYFEKLGASTERTALARELFSRSGVQLIPVLAQGSAATRELIEETKALGVEFDSGAAQRAEHFNDNLTKLGLGAEGVSNTLATALVPTLNDVTDAMVEWVKQNQLLVNQTITSWVDTLVQSLRDDLLPFLKSTYQEIKLIVDAINAVQAAAKQRVADDLAGGWQTGTGRLPRQGAEEEPTSEEVVNARARIAGLLRGPDAGAGKAESAARRAAREAERAAAELDKRTLESLNELEKQRLAILDSEVARRESALGFAQEDLALAQQLGASQETQLLFAQQIDDLERQRLEAIRERIQAELDALQQFGPVISAEVEKLNSELEIANQQIDRMPKAVDAVTRKFQESRAVVIDLSATLNESLQRVINGVLAGGGKGFNIGEIIQDTFRTSLSSVAGGFFEALTGGGDFKVEGFGGAVTNFGNITDKFAGAIDSLIGFFSGGSRPSSQKETLGPGEGFGTGLVSERVGQIAGFLGAFTGGGGGGVGPDGKPTPGSGVGAFGSFTNLFGAENLGAGGVAPSTGQNLIGAIPIIGTIITLAAAVAEGAVKGIQAFDKLKYTRGQTAGGLAGVTFSKDPVGGLWAGIAGEELGGRIHADLLSGGLFEILIAAGAFAPKSGGSITKFELSKLLNESGLPQQRTWEIGDRIGIRTRGLELAPNAEIQAQMRALGFGTGNLTAIGAPYTNIRGAPVPGDATYYLGKELEAAGKARPGVEALRGKEALGLAGALFGDQAGPAANALVNNLLLLGVSTEEARRQLLKMANTAGVTLIVGLEEISRAFNRSAKAAEDMTELQSAAAGLVELFSRDLPEAIDIDAIVRRRTTPSGIDIAGVQGDIVRAGLAFDLREQIKDVRFNQLTAQRQERSLRSQIADLDTRLADQTLTDPVRQRLLEERAQLGFDYVALAEQRFAPGSAARRRAVEFGLGIVEDTAKQLESFTVSIEAVQTANTDATAANTEATNANTAAIRGEAAAPRTLDINIHGGGETVTPAHVSAMVERAVENIMKSPKFTGAVKHAAFNR